MEQVIKPKKQSMTLLIVLSVCIAMIGLGFFFVMNIFQNSLPERVQLLRDTLTKDGIKTMPGLVRITSAGLMTNALFIVRSDNNNRSFHLKIYADDASADYDIKNHFYTDPLSPRIARVGTMVLFFSDAWGETDPLMVRIKEIFYKKFIPMSSTSNDSGTQEVRRASTMDTKEEDAKFAELDAKALELTGSNTPTAATTTPKVTLVVGHTVSNKPMGSITQVWTNEYGVDVLTVTVVDEKPCGFEVWKPSFEVSGNTLHVSAHSIGHYINCPAMLTTFTFTIKGLAKKDYTITSTISHEDPDTGPTLI